MVAYGTQLLTASGLAPTNSALDQGNIQALINLTGRAQLQAGIFSVSAPFTGAPGYVVTGAAGEDTGYFGDVGGGTILKLTAAFSGAAVFTAAAVNNANTMGPQIKNLAIDGSSCTASTVHGIQATGPVQTAVIEDVNISNMTGQVISTVQNPSAPIQYPFEWHVRRLKGYQCAGGGLSLINHTDATWDDVYLLFCGGNPETGVATAPGILISGTPGNSLFTNVRSEWSGKQDWYLTGVWNAGTGSGGCVLTGCSDDRANWDGFKVDATGNGPLVINGYMSRRAGANGNAGGGGYAGMNFAGATIPIVMSPFSIFPGVSDDGTGVNSPQIGLNPGNSALFSCDQGYVQGATTAIAPNTGGLSRIGAGVIAATGTPAAPGSYAGQTVNDAYELFAGYVDAEGGLRVPESGNSKQGTAVLVAGTKVVANTSVTASSRIMLTTQAVGGSAGFLVVSARTPGTSFTILSSNAADTSTVAYEIFEPG